VVVAIWRYVSVGSILAALVVPLLAVLWSYHWSRVLAAVLVALLVLYKHRDNFYRLRQGSEAKFF
jgi:glycerol-3-phosphate acyltransferase PlsY